MITISPQTQLVKTEAFEFHQLFLYTFKLPCSVICLFLFILYHQNGISKLPCAFVAQLTCVLPPGSCSSTDLHCTGCCFASFNEPHFFHSHLLTFAHTQAQLPHPKIPALTLLLIIVLPFFSTPILHKKNILSILLAPFCISYHSVPGHIPVYDLLLHGNFSGKGPIKLHDFQI